MTKETLTAKVSPKVMDRLEDYADREEISRSEATDRLLDQSLDVEESNVKIFPLETDGGTALEAQLEETQSDLNGISQEIEELKSHFGEISIPLVLCVLWIGTAASIGIPGGTPVVVVSGLLLVTWLAYVETRWWLDE